jgi:serine/threonine protein kinase/Tfp pilus assembly protein PilF
MLRLSSSQHHPGLPSGHLPLDDDEDIAPVVADMVRRWQAGERPTALDYLEAYPEFNSWPDAALRLIYEEICLRQEHGEDLGKDEWLARFPRWRKELEPLLECHALLGDVNLEEDLVGIPHLRDYTLVAELGVGSLGHVFLARQNTLDDRPVVLKISPRRGNEHLTLARLQHTAIVPLFAVEEDAAQNTRLLCMPYFGGTTLGQLLPQLQGLPVPRRRGQDLLAALDRLQAALPIQVPVRGPARQFLAEASYEQAIAWMGSCLAEALQFAHGRGCIHLDIKPANILVSADGQPMLLDFHIAQGPLARGGSVPTSFGGTPLYMSPEQRAAASAGEIGQPVPGPVDGRSDIFSLGLVLYEALGGSLPADASTKRELDLAHVPVSTGLRDILAQCLHPQPADRYADAAALAEDLRLHVQDQPLKGVRNRSWLERWRKWRRRRPAALPLAVMMTAVFLGASALALFSFHETNTRRQQAEQLDKTRRALVAEKLHHLADTFRFLAADPNLQGSAYSLEDRCREVWDQRQWLTTAEGGGLTKAKQQRLKADLLDFALIWSDLKVRLAAPQDKRSAEKKALAFLLEVDKEFGPSPLIGLHRQALGDSPQPRTQDLEPKTSWEHYALGRLVLSQGRLGEADQLFRRAVELDPGGFWPHFYQGRCAFEQGDFAATESAFRVCVALAPGKAVCHYNHGLALAKLGQDTQALAAFTRALHFETNLGPAAYQRGHLLVQGKRFNEARADFEHALACGHDPAKVHCQLALVHQAQNNRPAALAAAKHALDADSNCPQARALLLQLERK